MVWIMFVYALGINAVIRFLMKFHEMVKFVKKNYFYTIKAKVSRFLFYFLKNNFSAQIAFDLRKK